MIPAASIPLLRKLWPLFEAAGRKHHIDARLLLALGWNLSGLESSYLVDEVLDLEFDDPLIELLGIKDIPSDVDHGPYSGNGAGIMQLTTARADGIAQKLGRPTYYRLDDQTSIEFAAAYLSEQIEEYGLPRLGIAAYYVGTTGMAYAGGRVPDRRSVQRDVRNVMRMWMWLLKELGHLLERDIFVPDETNDEPLVTEAGPFSSFTTAGNAPLLVPPATTSTAGRGGVTLFATRPWKLVAPAEAWQTLYWVREDELRIVEYLATRLGLAYTRDETHRTASVGHRGTGALPHGRLIVPVPGADATCNGEYEMAEGLDVFVPYGSPVVAIGSGTIVVKRHEHAAPIPGDTDGEIILHLDHPFVCHGTAYAYAIYRFLSRLRFPASDNIGPAVEQGELIGWSGTDHRLPLLHLALSHDPEAWRTVSPSTLAAYFAWPTR